MTTHRLDARPEHLFWGYFDATTPPVLDVASGNEVTLGCLPAADPHELPPDGVRVLPEHRAALEAHARRRGATCHFMTGPVFIRGAEPGDVLQVDILDIEPTQGWSYTCISPLRGAARG